jgi:hypothetical protein
MGLEAAYIPAAISAGTSLVGAASASRTAAKQRRSANAAVEKQLAFQREQQRKLDIQKQKYRDFVFENPYKNVQNAYAGMENVYEDMTASTEAANFQMQQGAQQRSNIMQGLRGAAGGSGIAGLAQALANQGTLQARQVSTDIGKQEQAIQAARLAEASRLQGLERQGAATAAMTRMGGEALVQQAEADRQATLLGVAYGGAAGANQAVQAAYSNQMAAQTAASQMAGQTISALGTVAGAIPFGDIYSKMGFGAGGGGLFGQILGDIEPIQETYIPNK